MKKLSLLLIIFSFLTGCSTQQNSAIPQAPSVTNGPVAVPPNAQGAEVWFENIPYLQTSDTFPYRMNGGIWPNTKDNHSGNIDDAFDWNEDEVLYIQLKDKKYNGYEVVPVAVEQIGTEVLKIILQLKETDQSGANKAKPARVFIRFKKGALYQKRFLVVDEIGKTLK